MSIYQSQLLGTSLAGHDKDKVYVVIGQEKDFYLLADGTTKLLSRPKKKNQKHIQPIRHLPPDLLEAMREIRDDADIRRILKAYNNRKCNE